jgi:hypothetical protein
MGRAGDRLRAVAVAFSEGFTGHSTPRQLRGDALALAAGTCGA